MTPEEVREHRRGATVGHASDGRLFIVRALGETDTQTTVLEIPRAFAPERRAEQAEPRVTLAGRIGQVAHYRLLERLGRGGMGVVYRAEDTKLRRTVALKFLPSGLTRDLKAKARFLQEAQAASALDHTNICTIYEVGEAGDGELYLAMACYDGETVRAKIDRGPLPLAEALDVALQAAHGLAKAHRHGIVHRDIKPANLMVTSDGVVKILDFGIAKLTADQSLGGTFAGTPAYMSPEQARGEEVDARADVWALGVVLHEMLTGTRPSEGRLAPGLPKGLVPVLRNMLAPSLVDRYPLAVEALANLQAFQGSMSAARNTRRALLWSAMAALVVGVLAAGIWLSRREESEPPIQGTFTKLTDQEGREEYPSLSADGNSIAYVRTVSGQRDLYVQRVDGSDNPVLLTPGSPEDDTQPIFSPNGREIAFHSAREGGGIYRVPASGGDVRRITDFGYNPSWSPDGREIAVATEGIIDPARRNEFRSEIWRVDVITGRRRLVVGTDGVQPSWSPHGWRIAFWGFSAEGSRRVLWTVASEGGEPVKVVDDGYLNWNPVWSPDGAYLYFGSDRNGGLNLWRLPIDERSGKVLAEPQLIPISAPASGFWSIARDGRRIVYAANDSRANIERYPFDPRKLEVNGSKTPITRGSQTVRSCDVSPDGKWIAYFAEEDLFIIRSDGSGLRRLTKDRFKDRQPFWSPDGSKLLFYSNRGGAYQGWIISLGEGGGLRPILGARSAPLAYPIWSPDGRRVAGMLGQRAIVIDLNQPVQKRVPLPLLPAAVNKETLAPTSWSTDGDLLAGNMVQTDDPMAAGVGMCSLKARACRRLTNRGSSPIWLRDGAKLLYMDKGEVLALDLRMPRAPKVVLSPGMSTTFTAVSLSPDQHSLYAVREVEEGDVWLLKISASVGEENH